MASPKLEILNVRTERPAPDTTGLNVLDIRDRWNGRLYNGTAKEVVVTHWYERMEKGSDWYHMVDIESIAIPPRSSVPIPNELLSVRFLSAVYEPPTKRHDIQEEQTIELMLR